MAIVTVDKTVYKADSLFQWDKNQLLEIRGLSLPTIPEIHFTNAGMDKAIVRQCKMDDAGVITVEVPNSLLQKPSSIRVYVCIYEDETFKSLYTFEIKVKPRNKPTDYTLENDNEIYSFNALENLLNNTARILREEHDALNSKLVAEHKQMNEDLTAKLNRDMNTLEGDLRNQIEEDLSGANAAATKCEQAYQDCYDAINTWNFAVEDINGGSPATEEVTEEEDDLHGGTPY